VGHYAELWASDHPTLSPPGEFLEGDAPYLIVEHRMPAVWLALFGVDDVQVFSDLDDQVSLHVHLATPRQAALERLALRADWLKARFPTLQPAWLALFQSWLAALPQAYVHMDTEDVACMDMSEEAWAEELPRVLRMFDEPLAAPAPPAPPTPSGGLLGSVARWWRGAPPPAAAEPAPLTGWARYERQFGDGSLERSPPAWAFLGGNASVRPVPWDGGD